MLRHGDRTRTFAAIAVSVALLTVGIMLAGYPTAPGNGGDQVTPTPTLMASSGEESGGPIVDAQGRVVGINSWTMVSVSMNTKFAVPSNVLRDWLASDPSNDPAEAKLLARNYEDPLGRLSLDKYDDVTWEAQVPMDYLTPDYLAIVSAVGARQAASYIKQFGEVPFNENSE